MLSKPYLNKHIMSNYLSVPQSWKTKTECKSSHGKFSAGKLETEEACMTKCLGLYPDSHVFNYERSYACKPKGKCRCFCIKKPNGDGYCATVGKVVFTTYKIVFRGKLIQCNGIFHFFLVNSILSVSTFSVKQFILALFIIKNALVQNKCNRNLLLR